MKLGIIVLISLLFLGVLIFFLADLPPETTKVITPPPDEQIDLARNALAIAKEVYPDINIDSYIRRLDQMVYEIKLLMLRCGGDVNDPEYRITELLRNGEKTTQKVSLRGSETTEAISNLWDCFAPFGRSQ